MENRPVLNLAGLLGVLLIVLFIGLKLGGVGVVATWPWWLVLAPLWAPFAVFAAFWLVCLIVAFVITAKKRKKNER